MNNDPDYDSIHFSGYYENDFKYGLDLIKGDNGYSEEFIDMSNDEGYEDAYIKIGIPLGLPRAGTKTVTEMVVFENNGIKITYTGYDPYGDFSGPEISFKIENYSNKNYTVQVRNFSVDGYMIDPIFSSTVASGKIINDQLTLPSWHLEENALNADKIKRVDFSFHIFNADDWLDNFDTVMLSIDL